MKGPSTSACCSRASPSGDLHAFQDVWMPNHEDYLNNPQIENDVELLEPWYEGTDNLGLAVPDYMGVKSIADLNSPGTREIIGIEPSATIIPEIKNEVIPEYNLDMKLVTSSTAAMLAELERPTVTRSPSCSPVVAALDEPEYDFRYLEDPKNAQGNLDEPAKISAIVNEDLSEDDPVAYAFINNLRLNEEQLIALENAQAKEGEIKGVQSWLDENRDVIQPAIDAAKKAQ